MKNANIFSTVSWLKVTTRRHIVSRLLTSRKAFDDIYFLSMVGETHQYSQSRMKEHRVRMKKKEQTTLLRLLLAHSDVDPEAQASSDRQELSPVGNRGNDKR